MQKQLETNDGSSYYIKSTKLKSFSNLILKMLKHLIKYIVSKLEFTLNII